MYDMKTVRKPGPLTKADKAMIKVWQKEWGIKIDGIPGTQFVGQLAMEFGRHEQEVERLKSRIRQAYVALAVALAGGVGVLGSM